jgi:hypothetical protein
MKFRHISLAIATIAVLVPAVSNASPEKAALNACARAFASSLTSPGHAVPAVKVAYFDNRSSGSMFDFYDRGYVFDLHANNEKTGTAIARARCTTDTHGSVIALSSVPLGAAPPTLAAQF